MTEKIIQNEDTQFEINHNRYRFMKFEFIDQTILSSNLYNQKN